MISPAGFDAYFDDISLYRRARPIWIYKLRKINVLVQSVLAPETPGLKRARLRNSFVRVPPGCTVTLARVIPLCRRTNPCVRARACKFELPNNSYAFINLIQSEQLRVVARSVVVRLYLWSCYAQLGSSKPTGVASSCI